jgi:tetratricopeptide (TPR) repeat protein
MATSCDRNALLRYALGRLDTVQTHDVRRHVTECPQCAAYLTTVESSPTASGSQRTLTVVDELLSLAPGEWSQFFEIHRSRFANLGPVQALIQACEDRWDREPERADALSAFLTESADALPLSFASRALQSIAWTRRATMHQRRGRLSAALAAVDEARSRAGDIPVADYERALIAFTSADILSELQRTDEALEQIRGAATVFASFRDRRRHASALEMEATVLFRRGDYDEAVKIFHSLLESPVVTDVVLRGRLAANAAHCFVKTGQPARALPLFALAEDLFRELGYPNYVARIAWGKARALRSTGDETEAIDALRDVLQKFEKLSSLTECVRVGIELIEWLLPTGAFKDVKSLANVVHDRAIEANMQWQALEALEYLRTASIQDSLTADEAQYVRLFIEELRSSPNAVFDPPKA